MYFLFTVELHTSGKRQRLLMEEEDFEEGVEGFQYETEDTQVEVKEVEDVAPVMPTEYYENFESFLSRGPPKLKIDKLKTKSKRELELEIAQEFSAKAAVPVFPQISQKKGKQQQELPPRPVGVTATSKVAATLQGKGNKPSKDIDTNLLLQAFNYVAQLSSQDIDDDEAGHDSQPHQHPSSAPERRSPHKEYSSGKGGRPSASDGGGKKAGVVKKLRQKTQQRDAMGDHAFMVSAASEEELSSKKAQLDFDALVANFEQGITLHQLQAELNSSKASMAKSEEFMRQLAMEYGGMNGNMGSAQTKGKAASKSGSKKSLNDGTTQGYASKR